MKADSKKIILVIGTEHANERLDQALAKLLPDYSRTQLKTLIEAGEVLVDGKVLKAKTKLKGREEISLTLSEKSEKPPADWEAQPIPLNIVYEDEELMVINKPIGLVVHPGAGNKNNTLLNALLHHAPALAHLPRAGILHRLDKDTSGLLIIAKTPQALKHLSHQLKKRSLIREYQAIVYGTMISGGKIDAPIERHHTQRKRMAVSETGKPAVTHYRIAEKFRSHTHLLLRLETGRTHQIRVHLAHIHHPILGDPTYGGRVRLSKGMSEDLIQLIRAYKHQALHAFALGFEHPKTEESMRFEAPLPQNMQALLAALKEDKKRNPS